MWHRRQPVPIPSPESTLDPGLVGVPHRAASILAAIGSIAVTAPPSAPTARPAAHRHSRRPAPPAPTGARPFRSPKWAGAVTDVGDAERVELVQAPSTCRFHHSRPRYRELRELSGIGGDVADRCYSPMVEDSSWCSLIQCRMIRRRPSVNHTRRELQGRCGAVTWNASFPVTLVVQKYGGTSVADLDRIRNVAARVKRQVLAGDNWQWSFPPWRDPQSARGLGEWSGCRRLRHGRV